MGSNYDTHEDLRGFLRVWGKKTERKKEKFAKPYQQGRDLKEIEKKKLPPS